MAGRWKTYALVAIIILVVLATTHVWNPWPNVWSWVNTSKPIAGDAARWQQRIGGSPQSVTVAGDAVIVEYRTSVDAYDLTAGLKLWNNNADWAAVAGQGTSAVVVTGRLLTKGYQVLDPRTGVVLRDEKTATAVWTYQDAVLDLHCGKGNECQLTAWDPRGSTPKWTVDTGGIGFVLDAANPDLPDTRQLTASNVDDQVAGPRPMPGLIGLPDDGKIRVIDTATGKVAQVVEPGRDQRVAMAGGRVLTITGTPQDGTCYYSVVATDPPAAGAVWQRDGLNLRTSDDGSDCKQDHDPAGGEDVVLGVDPVGRQELLAGHDGRVLWHGAKGEDVLAVDDQSAVIRSADKTLLRGYAFSRGRTSWARQVGPKASAALTPNAVIIVTFKPGRVAALSRSDGKVLSDVRTEAKVFAVGPAGMIVVAGRDMAYLPFA
ncbi:PQQ-binding-like beta-propeller repeat protein [Actinoplanes sp. TBRC 11911]|uniref:PQQ-binding-like beta-propeller repeat protein n=1 Tax=Actinoplanes sp. TBRC 11911 TaxID=2729386 RepID=UPI00145F8E4D|nr:PQQ-binding-like beta-propeller repeat protein [Actinoplanes sp. TBRC 11911]NMO52106.1 PQQ-binding-like beta-propeller repeat protein [Actinoplanes sp. TBRC 11911]